MQQVGLADAGGAVDEQRVVGVAGKLGHGQRRGMGEAVGVADDELLERQVRVDPVVLGDGRVGSGGAAALAASGGAVARRRAHLDGHPRAEDGGDRGLQHAREALGHPGAQLARCLDDEDVAWTPAVRSGASQRSYMSAGTAWRSSSWMALQMWSGSSVTAGKVGSSTGSVRRQNGGGGRPAGDRRGDYSNGFPAQREVCRRALNARRKSRRKPPTTCAHALCKACARECRRRPRARLARRSPDPSPRHEAHLSAQEAQACPYPRVSQPHEHAGRSLMLKRRRDKGRKRLTV